MIYIKSKTDNLGNKFHTINGINIFCSGKDCRLCKQEKEKSFTDWENSIPLPVPKNGKRYKNPIAQKNRGKTIREICYTCKEIPCYICKRNKCPQWMKEENRKGKEEGCSSWENGRCISFICEKNLIKTKW
jgi:hypothetical protein